MADDRLPTHIWVDAHLRRCSAEAVPAVVIHKGEKMGGTIMLKIYQPGTGCRLLSQMRDLDGTLRALRETLEPGGLLTTISHLYRESRIADSLLDEVTRKYGYPHFLSGVQRKALLERHDWNDIRRYRFYHRHPFDPTDFLGHPPDAIALARQLYERAGALVVTARR